MRRIKWGTPAQLSWVRERVFGGGNGQTRLELGTGEASELRAVPSQISAVCLKPVAFLH